MHKPRLIAYNDARHYMMYRYDPPLSLHQLRQPVDEILGTGVDTLSYGLASGQTFLHDTKVGNKWGDSVTLHNHGVMWWRAAESLKQALAAGHDPLKVVIDRAHEKGIQVVASLRMNDPATGEGPKENRYFLNRLKEEHPEVMIGEVDPNNPHAATCLNFALPEVQAERLAVIEEVCDRYGADGLEMDEYVRVYFKASEAEKNTPVLTDFVRKVRALLDRIGEKRGTRLALSARVHPVESENLRIGADVRTWMKEKLIDWVVPYVGGFEIDPNPSFGGLADMAQEHGVWLYAPMGRTPYDDRHHQATIEMARAAATNYYAAGADGMYLADLPWPPTGVTYQALRELGDPDIFARKTKHYLTAQREENSKPTDLQRHIPVTLEEGVTARVPMTVGDDLDSARRDGELKQVTLRVRIIQYMPEDRLTFKLNGKALTPDPRKTESFYGGIVSYTAARGGQDHRINTHYWFEMDVPIDLLRQGENVVEVTLDRRFEALKDARVLKQAEIVVEYYAPPIPAGGQM